MEEPHGVMGGGGLQIMQVHKGSDDLVVELGRGGDGNAHRSGGPYEIARGKEAQQAVGRLLSETVVG
jgi:hypothetical protein